MFYQTKDIWTRTVKKNELGMEYITFKIKQLIVLKLQIQNW